MNRTRRAKPFLTALLATSLLLAAAPSVGTAAPSVPDLPGLARLLAAHEAGGARPVRAIARLDRIPTTEDARALRGLGLVVQPMRRLPLAIVAGPVDAMVRAVIAGAASDVYPDDRLEYHDRASADAIMAASVRAKGLTGKGVTVGIVDSGCDGSHPDLADHVVHNVKLVSAEYVNLRPESTNTLVIATHDLPYNNTDIGSGHGTHVAGIVAADGTTDPDHIGVAPDAELVCMAIGEVIFTTAVVTAYDYLLDQPDLLGVDVVNNSWGNSFRQFDPRDPVHTATKAVADQGVFVAFASGNAGGENGEMSINPFSIAPWVMSVARMDNEFHRGDSSSNGLMFDNSRALPIGPGGHTTFLGHTIGLYKPDITAPGSSVSSSCDTIGVAVGPCPPGENTEASGTSMASPHVAGAAAVLLQANPKLTPRQIRRALTATARPVMGYDTEARAPFWQVGFGRVDLARAVALVQRRDFSRAIERAHAAVRRRVLDGSEYEVVRTDFWTYDAPPVAIAGSDERSFVVEVPRGVTHLKVTVGHPSGQSLLLNGMQWPVEVRDAAGKLLATTEEQFFSGTGTAMIDLEDQDAEYGEFTLTAYGDLAVSDPDTLDSESALGRMVIVHAAQLVQRLPVIEVVEVTFEE